MSRMPLTTDKQMLAGIVDQLRIFLAPRRIEHQHVFLHDHLGEADDGVERRAQLVAHGGEEARLRRIRLFGDGARLFQRLLLHLAVGDVAHHGDDLGFAGGLLERATAHLDPDEIGGNVLAAHAVAPQPEFDAARLAAARRIRQRGEIGRTIGDMDAVEQAMALKPRHRRAEHGFGGGRDELHRAGTAMARDHVAHVARQQAIAIFLDVEQRHAGARQQLRAERKARGIERCGRDAKRDQYAAQGSAGVRRRQQFKMAEHDQQRRARQRQR